MNEKELEELQEPGNWDYDNAVTRPGLRKPRVVVSVSFGRDDFDTVAKHAERVNLRTSEFIRKAALSAAHCEPSATVVFLGGSLGILTTTPAPATRVYGAETLVLQERLSQANMAELTTSHG